jgi:hypothetical protein
VSALLRLNTDGRIDPTFNAGGFVNGSVTDIAVEAGDTGVVFALNLFGVNWSWVGSVARMKAVANPFLSVTSARQATTFELLLIGETGKAYRIDATTNLFDWFSLGTVTLTNSTQPFVDANLLGFDRRFYRAVLVP